MKQHEARRVIWERLAITAREDGENVDWTEDGYDTADVRRLEKASKQVAESIERRLEKPKKK